MEWEAAALVLSARPFGEGSAIVHLFTEEHGRCAGLARGGASRRQASLWQPGNLALVHWRARLADQLGQVTGELVHPAAATILDAPLSLAMLSSVLAVADATLPEREAYPALFLDTVRLVALIAARADDPPMALLVAWELALLGEIGFGLDLGACAVTGSTSDLRFVSPKTGRAVSGDAAGVWRDRLLRLPAFLRDPDAPSGPEDWRDGLDLTAHFLSREALGQRHVGLPAARLRLRERIGAMISA